MVEIKKVNMLVNWNFYKKFDLVLGFCFFFVGLGYLIRYVFYNLVCVKWILFLVKVNICEWVYKNKFS